MIEMFARQDLSTSSMVDSLHGFGVFEDERVVLGPLHLQLGAVLVRVLHLM